MSVVLLLGACFGPSPPARVDVRVVTQAPGLSPADIEARVTLPIEEALAELSPEVTLHALSAPGMSMVTATLPEAQLSELVPALDRILLPDGAYPPMTERMPAEVSDWIVPASAAREVVDHGSMALGLGAAWTFQLATPGHEIVLPDDPEHRDWVASLPDRMPDLASLLERPGPDGRALRQLAAVEEVPPRVWATFDGEPAALVHIARPAAEARRLLLDHVDTPVQVPSEHVLRVESWGTDADLDARAQRIAAAMTSAGAAHVLVLGRRPLVLSPSQGRVEVLAAWTAPPPELELSAGPGEWLATTPWPVVERAVTGTTEALAPLWPPQAVEIDVAVDQGRVQALGLSTQAVSEAIREALAGRSVELDDGSAVVVRTTSAAQDGEALGRVHVGTVGGQPVSVRDIATITLVQTPRVLERVDGRRGLVVTYPPPVDVDVLRTEPPTARFPW
jgi:hypothetical protein